MANQPGPTAPPPQPFSTYTNSVWYWTSLGWIEQLPKKGSKLGVHWTTPTTGYLCELDANGVWQARQVNGRLQAAPRAMVETRKKIFEGQSAPRPAGPPPQPAKDQPAPAASRDKKGDKDDNNTDDTGSSLPTRPTRSWSGDSRNAPFRGRGARWPQNRIQYQQLRQSFTETPHRNYGGTRGDGAVMNWALAGASAITAAVVAAFSYQFLQAYAQNDGDGAGPQNLKYAYYACQALFALSILTAVLLALYILWVFIDSRHPMRKAYLTLAENNGGNVQSGRGKTAQWPGVSTMSLEKVSRMTTHRLYAKQAHIKKMLAVYGMLLIVWCVPFLVTTLADGYLTYREIKNESDVKIVEICGIEKSRELCWHLAKAGIASGVMTALLTLSLIVTAVALQARPTFGTTRT